ncbi:MAG: metallophosphoesterase [Oscillospiraceae bacterium]|nr:metallophosphoesterase [Oscillospiraceae bacterium]
MTDLRIVVLSDTHGRVRNFEKVVKKQPSASFFIHLGDGGAEVEIMRADHPRTAFVTVKGNCDFSSDEPYEKLMVMNEKRIFFTHGHQYSVKSGLSAFLSAAKARDADIALFGHTHQPYSEYADGVYIMNPGSAERPRRGRPSYGVIDVTDAGVFLFHVEL